MLIDVFWLIFFAAFGSAIFVWIAGNAGDKAYI